VRVNFRNLAGRPLERWVALLAAAHYDAGERVLIRTGSTERVKALDSALWIYDPGSFLPHGTSELGRVNEQPVFITDGEDNTNEATALIVTDQSVTPASDGFTSVDYVFDRTDPDAREAARQRWRNCKEAGYEPVYWEASAEGWRRAS